MRRILFLCEHVTWSQIVRSLVLARGLDRREFDVHFACGTFDPRLFGRGALGGERLTRHALHSVDPKKIEAALEAGEQLYEKSVLARYVDAERQLFDEVRPDLVVSDLRWSTAISAPLAGVPCATLVNAFWSPHAVRDRFPLPDHPILKLVGIPTAEKYFPLALPKVLAHFAKPVNELRKKHRLPEIGDLHRVITWGDRTLFPDDASLVPLAQHDPRHVFLGPILWTPEVPLPEGFDELGRTRPLVYATLGSSGDVRALPAVIEALGRLPVDALVATAGRATPRVVPPNVRLVEMVPGDVVARKATVVVCNGGASTAYQSLAEGTPVVGIPSNLDQFLAMTAIRDAGAGVQLRASTVTADAVRESVARVLREPTFHRRARELALSFSRHDVHARFRAVVDELTLGSAVEAAS
ncbi:MAG: glycosyl transferase family 1 [Verrucomicrobia bacterium]|nr:glycosyl transferase family 1 [Verrucomicrobiota bacterium]